MKVLPGFRPWLQEAAGRRVASLEAAPTWKEMAPQKRTIVAAQQQSRMLGYTVEGWKQHQLKGSNALQGGFDLDAWWYGRKVAVEVDRDPRWKGG